MNTLVLVKFQCGCVGSIPGNDGTSAILQACDSDDGNGHGMRNRPMGGQDYQPVAPDYIEVIWQKYVQAENAERMARAIRVLVMAAEVTP